MILLLDTYFKILIWEGQTIQSWREQGYHEKPEYENVKILMEAPQEDAKNIVEKRFPCPEIL